MPPEKSQKELASSVQKKLVPVKKERVACSAQATTPPVAEINLGTPKRNVKKESALPSSFFPESSQESSPGSCDNPLVINDNESDDSSVVDMTSTTYEDPSKNFVIEVDGAPHVLISGKPFPKKLIDELDDDASAWALHPNGDVTTVYRNETNHERRVRRLNRKVSKKILEFVEHVRNWVDALSTEHRFMKFSDARWAFEILPAVAHEMKDMDDLLVAASSEKALLNRLRSVQDRRTAHFLQKFSNHDGRPYKMAPKGNLMKRNYLFYTEFCLNQQVEY